VTANKEFNRLVWRTALLTVGLLAALIIGVIVLAGGDWLPGGSSSWPALSAWPGRSR